MKLLELRDKDRDVDFAINTKYIVAVINTKDYNGDDVTRIEMNNGDAFHVTVGYDVLMRVLMEGKVQ